MKLTQKAGSATPSVYAAENQTAPKPSGYARSVGCLECHERFYPR
jgi:hypothetical protein